jgi:tryptophanyl-tRNA synthetase
MKERVFSGIQPTGELHIGNYLGAIKNWAGLIDKYDCIFCIVDLHAITIEYDIKMMQKRIFDAACVNMACGLDPEKCTLFVQSDVAEHTELAWILDTVTPFGELSRMTQFKDKSQQNSDNVNVGLFNYPVLMAADIMLYDACIVPVGQDQVQHLEFTREVVRDFNNRYGEVFFEPKELLSEAKKIIGLDGERKMSKSMNNYISLTETEDSLKKKLMGAKTDPARIKRDDPGNPNICNIYSLHKFFTPDSELKEISSGCKSAAIGCVDCKRKLQANIMSELSPIQEKKAAMEKTPSFVYDVLNQGAKRCKALGEEKLIKVKDAMGLLRK